MNRVYNGWISVPVLMVVMVLTVLLVNYQSRLYDSHYWHLQRSQITERATWHESYTLLAQQSASASPCNEFCSLSSGQWVRSTTSNGVLWWQKQRVEHLHVERWCASKDQQLARCWWIHDNGAYTSLLLSH